MARICLTPILCASVALLVPAARASQLNLPPAATEGMKLMHAGQPDRAQELFRKLEAESPEHPLGYLLEAEALWWKLYCSSLEWKFNTLDAWSHARASEDDTYLALADKAARLAGSAIAKSDTAEMELYAGMGYLLRARLLGLRFEKSPTAHAGVEARKHLLRCLELDPDMADAYTGLGLYNYYVDTLSGFAKILRFFMGIPGGSKRDGLRQLETAMAKGELTPVEARFYTAKNLRNYEREYAHAAEVALPLLKEYPQNPLFQLLAADIAAKLGHHDEAVSGLRAAVEAPGDDPGCAARLAQVVREGLTALATGPKN
jgi:tetratricopeptide (TPR) repeat protein